MRVLLAEQIRQFRRDRHLTQEQLAEVLGVAVGTVSKWESGNSAPDLALVMEMADFFGTSVDVLLGYRQQSASLTGTIDRLRAMRNAKQYVEGRREAEKAVKRFPNSFDVFYQSAALLEMAALEGQDRQAARRAEQLYLRALELMDQNKDPKISRTGIGNGLANLALVLGESRRGVELLKQNNVEGVNNAVLGQTLARMPGHRQEALEYLEKALLNLLPQLFSVCIGYLNIADAGSGADAADARALALLVIRFCQELRQPGSRSLLDKYLAALWCCCALMSEKQMLTDQAASDLKQARRLARQYDADPVRELNLRLIRTDSLRDAAVFDDFGSTACSGVEQLLKENAGDSPRLSTLWEAMKDEDTDH